MRVAIHWEDGEHDSRLMVTRARISIASVYFSWIDLRWYVAVDLGDTGKGLGTFAMRDDAKTALLDYLEVPEGERE